MISSWLRLMIVIGLGFLISAQAFARDSLPGLNTMDASKNQPYQQKIWNSKDKKFEVKAGIVRRYWLEQENSHLDLEMLGTDYQLGISLFSGAGEFEFAFAGGKSGGQKQYFQNEIDRNKLILLWEEFLFIGDVPVKLNYTENIKLWDFQLHYWHNVAGSKRESFQIGPGTHFYVLEKHAKIQARYEDWGPDFLILNPAYQNSESHSTTLIPGLSFGARGKVDVGSGETYLGSLMASGEYVFAKPISGISIGGQPLNKFNNFNFALQYGYTF